MTDRLWAWQVLENGEWGNIAAVIPGLPGLNPLIVRHEELARGVAMTYLAAQHGAASRMPIRLAVYELIRAEPMEDT